MRSILLKNLAPSLLTVSLVSSFGLTLPSKTLAQELTLPQIVAQTSSQLNEDNIRQTMEAIEKAENGEDIEDLLNFLVPFAISEVTVEVESNRITTTLEGIEPHRQLLKNTFKLVKDRETIKEYTKIKITADGHIATVIRTMIEEITLEDGRKFIASGTDTFRFAWIDNQPKIISTKSQGWIEERTVE